MDEVEEKIKNDQMRKLINNGFTASLIPQQQTSNVIYEQQPQIQQQSYDHQFFIGGPSYAPATQNYQLLQPYVHPEPHFSLQQQVSQPSSSPKVLVSTFYR